MALARRPGPASGAGDAGRRRGRTARRSTPSWPGRTFPLAEPGMLTFAWRGEAEHVHLVRWIHGGGDRLPFVRLARHRPLAAAAAGRGRRAVRVQARRSGATAARSWIVDPLNPARAGDPFGENSVARTLGYERPDWSLPRGAPAGRIEEIAVDEPRLRRDARACGSTCRPGTIRRAPIRWSSIHDGDDFVTYADLPVVLDNLIDAGDDPAGDRGAGADPRPAGRILRRPAARALPGRASCCRRSARAGASSDGAAASGCCSAPASARSPRSPPPSAIPGVFGGLVLKSGSFILDERKLARRPHPVFHRIARLMRALRRAPDLPRDPRLRLDRRARGAGRREPGACKLLARTRRRCFVQERVGRPPLAQLARPAPRRAALGAAARRGPDQADGAARPRPGHQGGTGNGASAPSTSACRSAPTSAGRSPTRACSTALEARPQARRATG